MVGLLPLCATTVVEPWQRERVPNLLAQMATRIEAMPSLLNFIHPVGPEHRGCCDRGIIALLDRRKLVRILSRLLDEDEFLSPYGIRSISRYHKDHPYVFWADGRE